jgi:hypothetical protein
LENVPPEVINNERANFTLLVWSLPSICNLICRKSSLMDFHFSKHSCTLFSP